MRCSPARRTGQHQGSDSGGLPAPPGRGAGGGGPAAGEAGQCGERHARGPCGARPAARCGRRGARRRAGPAGARRCWHHGDRPAAGAPGGPAAQLRGTRSRTADSGPEAVRGDRLRAAGGPDRLPGTGRFPARRRAAAGRAGVEAAARQTSECPTPTRARRPPRPCSRCSRSAYRGGTLDELLLWEVMAPLRRRSGRASTKRWSRKQAADFGLDKDEAGILAAAMLAEAATEGRAARSRRTSPRAGYARPSFKPPACPPTTSCASG